MSSEQEDAIRQTVKAFIARASNVAQLDDDDEDLFETGLVNSLFAVQLMTFLEKTFAIEVGLDDLDIQNFKSVNATTAFVVQKTHRVPA